MTMKMLRSALGAVALLSTLSAADAAQKSFVTKDAPGTGTLSFCAFDASTFGLAPCHINVTSGGAELFTSATPGMVGLAFGGSALSLGQKTKAGGIPMTPPSDPDTVLAAGTITAADAASASTAGQNGILTYTGTPTANSVWSQSINGTSDTVVLIYGTFSGTIQFEGSNDGAHWAPVTGRQRGSAYTANSVTGGGLFMLNTAGLSSVRARASAWTSGTASLIGVATASAGSFDIQNPLRLFDNATGNQASIDVPANIPVTKPALAMYDAVLAGLWGNPSDAAWGGTGNPASFYALWKAIYGQAATALASPSYRIASAASGSNATNFATGAKKVTHVRFCNVSSSFRSVKFYDKASAPVPGTDTIVTSIPAPAGFCPAIDFQNGGFPFANGVSIAITASALATDTGSSVAAGDIVDLNVEHN